MQLLLTFIFIERIAELQFNCKSKIISKIRVKFRLKYLVSKTKEDFKNPLLVLFFVHPLSNL